MQPCFDTYSDTLYWRMQLKKKKKENHKNGMYVFIFTWQICLLLSQKVDMSREGFQSKCLHSKDLNAYIFQFQYK